MQGSVQPAWVRAVDLCNMHRGNAWTVAKLTTQKPSSSGGSEGGRERGANAPSLHGLEHNVVAVHVHDIVGVRNCTAVKSQLPVAVYHTYTASH